MGSSKLWQAWTSGDAAVFDKPNFRLRGIFPRAPFVQVPLFSKDDAPGSTTFANFAVLNMEISGLETRADDPLIFSHLRLCVASHAGDHQRDSNGSASARAVVAQPAAAMEMNWSAACG